MSEARPAAPATPVPDPLHSLVDWSAGLPLWQRDALRRLYQSGQITDADLSDLLLICKAERGLTTPTHAVPAASPLDPSHVPVTGTTGAVVALKSIGATKHVNALASNQSLNFRENGLTVIYGGNGSGKSGYVRVLKKLCRARCEDDILHNVYEARPTEPASAQIRYTVAGAGQPALDWRDGGTRPDALSAVSIFDTGCAPVYLEGATGLAYTPAPLRILQQLAGAAQAMKRKLQEEENSLLQAMPAGLRHPTVHTGTSVAACVNGLRADSVVADIERMASLTDTDRDRLTRLRTDLASDPARAARALAAQHARLRSLMDRADAVGRGLTNEVLQDYRTAMRDAEVKAEAARIAATALFNGEPLPKVGSATWRALWEAAREYSVRDAYVGSDFPNTAASARCVLCQQVLQPDAAVRMVSFEQFVRENAQKVASDAAQFVASLRQGFQALTMTRKQIRDAVALMRDELDQQNLANQLRGWLARAYVRCRQILRTGKSDPWPSFQNLPPTPLIEMAAVATAMELRISELQTSAGAVERQKLQKELNELTDREWLGTVLDDVRLEIARHQRLTAYELAKTDADTNKITRRSTELARTLVTDALRDRFMEEVNRLGLGHLRLELRQETGSYGASRFSLVLVRSDSTKLATVLSEGEHRCVALAAFLTELATADNHSGIVFDDPVCSLDHEYRERIAQRLAEEAHTGRQVIVFTHDVAFLFMLDEAIRKCGATIEYRSVNRRPDACGFCHADAPMKVQPPLEALDSLEAHLHGVRHSYDTGDMPKWNMDVRGLYGTLRDIWELAAEQAVTPVIRRFSNKVRTGGLRKLTVLTDADCKALSDGFGRCSEQSHSDSPVLGRAVPTPGQVKAEIETLRGWVRSVTDRQNKIT